MLKRIIFVLLAVSMLTACGLYKGNSINDVQLGSTKQEVDSQFGYPLRKLSMGNVGGQYSEVYEYKIRNSVYALEYVGNRLNYVELLYDYDEYYPSGSSHNRPPNYYPNRPPGNSGGGSNVRPPTNPGGGNKPGTNRPESVGRPNTSTKPVEPSKPETGTNRPSTSRPAAVGREEPKTTEENKSSSNSSSSTSRENSQSSSRTRSTGSSSSE